MEGEKEGGSRYFKRSLQPPGKKKNHNSIPGGRRGWRRRTCATATIRSVPFGTAEPVRHRTGNDYVGARVTPSRRSSRLSWTGTVVAVVFPSCPNVWMSVMNNSGTTTPSGNVEPDDSGSSSSSSPLRHFRLNCLPQSCYSIHDILHYNPASPDDPSVSIQSQFDSLDCPPSSTQPPPPPYNNNNGLLLLDHHVPSSSSSAHLGKKFLLNPHTKSRERKCRDAESPFQVLHNHRDSVDFRVLKRKKRAIKDSGVIRKNSLSFNR